MIEIDPGSLTHQAAGHLLNALVVPRPIAWVSTVAADGCRNLAPHSYFNAVSAAPAVVQFASTRSSAFDPAGMKDTLRNIRAVGEFVVNMVSEDLLEAMNSTSVECPPEVDEFDIAQLQSRPSVKVRPPRVARARAALECRLYRMLDVGDATVVFGQVVYVHVSPEAWVGGRARIEGLRPVARLGGSEYAGLGEPRTLRRPSWAASALG